MAPFIAELLVCLLAITGTMLLNKAVFGKDYTQKEIQDMAFEASRIHNKNNK